MKNIEELLDFYLTANNETRKNVTGLIKEAINTSVKIADNKLVIGILGKTAILFHICWYLKLLEKYFIFFTKVNFYYRTICSQQNI